MNCKKCAKSTEGYICVFGLLKLLYIKLTQ